MNKIYLVGTLYDDFCDEGFTVYGVATTIEKAKEMAKNLSGDVEIREWEVDKLQDYDDYKKI